MTLRTHLLPRSTNVAEPRHGYHFVYIHGAPLNAVFRLALAQSGHHNLASLTTFTVPHTRPLRSDQPLFTPGWAVHDWNEHSGSPCTLLPGPVLYI